METKDKRNKVVKNDLIHLNKEVQAPREKENIEKSSSSKIISQKFSKQHGTVHNSLGESHEPGTIPGTGV